jgi:hypothetical protein
MYFDQSIAYKSGKHLEIGSLVLAKANWIHLFSK